jgi:hypothetical protein
MASSSQVVADLLRRARFRAIDKHLHLTLLGPDHHRLLAQAAHHVERALGLPAERELEHVLLDAALDDLPELLRDGKEAIGRAEPLQGLVGPPVVVVLHPEPDPRAGRLEAVELRALEELLPEGLPEALDLAQRHGMVRPALQVVHPILLELGLEPRGPAPARVLPALIGKHLLRDAVLRHRPAVDLQDVLRRLAAEDVQPHHVAGVVVEEADQVGVLAAQPEGEDVGLPELVRRGALEEARPGGIPLGFGARLLEELVRVEGAADRLPAHGQKQDAPQELADLLDPEVGLAPLELEGLPLHRGGHLGPRASRPPLPLQARFPLGAIPAHPRPERTEADAELAGDLLDGEAFLEAELHRFAPELKRVGVSVGPNCPSGRPPTRASPVPLPLNLPVLFHGSHSLGVLPRTPGFGVSPVFPTCFCSRSGC